MSDRSALSDSDAVIAVEIGCRLFGDFRSWTEKTSSSSTVLLTLLGTLRFPTTAVSWRASLFFRRLSKEINTPPREVLSQTFGVSILFMFFFFSCLVLMTTVTIFACWMTSFPFLQLLWGLSGFMLSFKGNVIQRQLNRHSFEYGLSGLLALWPWGSHYTLCLHFLGDKEVRSSRRFVHL